MKTATTILAVQNKTGRSLDIHCRNCGCVSKFDKIDVMARARDNTEREIMELFFMKHSGDKCVSTPPLSVFDRDFSFLDGYISCLMKVTVVIFCAFKQGCFTSMLLRFQTCGYRLFSRIM